MAGGTDLLVHWPQRTELHLHSYLDLSGVEELRPHRWEPDELVLGGLTTYWDIIEDRRARSELPLLIDAARQVGSIQIQTRGSWAGNIVNASPAADGVPVLMAYDAVVVLESTRGRSVVPLSGFYSGYKEMRRSPDELVAVEVLTGDVEGGLAAGAGDHEGGSGGDEIRRRVEGGGQQRGAVRMSLPGRGADPRGGRRCERTWRPPARHPRGCDSDRRHPLDRRVSRERAGSPSLFRSAGPLSFLRLSIG